MIITRSQQSTSRTSRYTLYLVYFVQKYIYSPGCLFHYLLLSNKKHHNDSNEKKDYDHPVPACLVLPTHNSHPACGVEQPLIHILSSVINIIDQIVLLSHFSEYVMAHSLLSPDDIS